MTRSEQVKDWVQARMSWLEGEIERQVPDKYRQRHAWCNSRLLARVLVASVLLVMLGCFILVVRSATRQMPAKETLAGTRFEPRPAVQEQPVRRPQPAKRPGVEEPLPPPPVLDLDPNATGNGKGSAGYIPPRRP